MQKNQPKGQLFSIEIRFSPQTDDTVKGQDLLLRATETL